MNPELILCTRKDWLYGVHIVTMGVADILPTTYTYRILVEKGRISILKHSLITESSGPGFLIFDLVIMTLDGLLINQGITSSCAVRGNTVESIQLQ